MLVISQFVKPDGEVLKPHVTGLCQKAQTHLKRITLRAQRAGVFSKFSIIVQQLQILHGFLVHHVVKYKDNGLFLVSCILKR